MLSSEAFPEDFTAIVQDTIAAGRSLQTPPVVAAYFHEDAIVTDEFTPGKGWTRVCHPGGLNPDYPAPSLPGGLLGVSPYGMRKRISLTWAAKLRRQGVTHVALVPVSNPNRAPADFSLAEILAGQSPLLLETIPEQE